MKKTKFFVKILIVAVAMYSHASVAQQSQGQSPMVRSVSTEKIIRDYYAAYEKKDWNLMESILADGFTFTSPNDDHINLKIYKERCWPNANNTKRFDLEKIIIDGDDAFVTYNGWTTDGRLFRNTERFKFKDGKIKENECFFGTGVSFPNNTKK
jgi:ketosteroid isomerase-like protein